MNWRNFSLGIAGGLVATGVGIVVWAWAKSQYHQGRLDATRHIIEESKKILEDLKAREEEREKEEEERIFDRSYSNLS